jgi:hypothetical protein
MDVERALDPNREAPYRPSQHAQEPSHMTRLNVVRRDQSAARTLENGRGAAPGRGKLRTVSMRLLSLPLAVAAVAYLAGLIRPPRRR